MAVTLDLVKPLKLESPSSGGTQLDIGPTEANPHQDALAITGAYIQEPTGTGLDRTVGITRDTSRLVLTDSVTSHVLGELVSASTGQVGSHNALLDVVHFLPDGPGDAWASGATSVDNMSGPLLTSTVWYTDATLAKRIVSIAYTYNGPLIATAKLALYGVNGTTIVRTVTDTYNYSGPLRTGRTRTFGTT